MSSLDADLVRETIRRLAHGTELLEAEAALTLMEAEVARLRQENDTWTRVIRPTLIQNLHEEQERAEAAEREVARLREGLRREIEAYPTLYEGLRALLAEDGAAHPQIGVRWKGDYPHLIGGIPDEDGAA